MYTVAAQNFSVFPDEQYSIGSMSLRTFPVQLSAVAAGTAAAVSTTSVISYCDLSELVKNIVLMSARFNDKTITPDSDRC